MTLKTKLISGVVAISAFIILSCSLFAYFAIHNLSTNVDDMTATLSENVNRDVSGFAGHYAGTLIHLEGKNVLSDLDHLLSSTKDDLAILKETQAVRSGNTAATETLFAQFIENNQALNALFVSRNGLTYASSPANSATSDTSWAEQGAKLKNGQFYLSDVTVRNSEQFVTISTPIYNGTVQIGTIGAELSLKPFQTALAETKVGDNGYVIITDQNGTIIAHPDQALVQKQVDELPLFQKMTDDGKVLFDPNQVSYLPITQEQSGWTVLPIIPAGEIKAFSATISQNMSKQIKGADDKNAAMLRSMVSTQGLVIIGLIILTIVISWLMARYLIRPINELSQFMARVAEGDLTQKMKVKSKDEIGKLLHSVNVMIDSLRSIVNRIDRLADEATNDSNILKDQSDTSSHVSRIITEAMDEVSSGAELLSSDLITMSEHVNGNVSSIDTMNQNLTKIAEHSRETKTASEHGRVAMENMSGNMQTIVTQSNESTRLMQSLDKRLQQISEITQMIQDISEQTNLLSLNASIEAAQAGEHGRGFAVVAQEVKNLAQQSSESVDRVAGLIHEIQRDSKQSLQFIEQSRQSVEEGEKIAQESELSFEQISKFIEYLSNDIEQITAESNKLTEGSREILDSIERITGISQTTTAGVEEVNGTTHEQKAASQKVNDIAANLHRLTEELKGSIQQFKL